MMNKKVGTAFLIVLSLISLTGCIGGGMPPFAQTGYMPFPSENPGVYMESQNIVITINDLAKVNATYIFINPQNNSTEQLLFLPFYLETLNLEIKINDKPLNYSWTTVRWQSGLGYCEKPGVELQLCFNASEQKIVNILYEIEHFRLYPEGSFEEYIHGNTYYCMYILETGATWYHPIEDVNFTFKINKKYDPVYSKYGINELNANITEDETYDIIMVNYSNWTLSDGPNVVGIKFRSPGHPNEWNIILVIIFISIIALIAIVLIVRHRKKSKR